MAKNKMKTMDSFYKKKIRLDEALVSDVACPDLEEAEGGGGGEEEEEEKEDDGGEEEQPVEEEEEEEAPLRINRVNDGSGVLVVERDPGLRCQLWDLPVNDQEKARKAYVKCGAYHFKKEIYPPTGPESHPRRFQYHWFKAFPWLEYSPTENAVFCFPCFLFSKKPLGKVGSDVFTVKGFKNWRKVNNGKKQFEMSTTIL